jgi:TRAP-type C4-dicarboxylate transport system permease small subunit
MCIIGFFTVAICLDVLRRYFFNSTITGLTEITTLLLVYVPFLGAAWALKGEKHIVLDTVLTIMKPRTRAFTMVMTSSAGILIGAILVYFGTLTTVDLFRRGVLAIAISIPFWLYSLAIPIGGLMLFIQFIRRTLLNWKLWRQPESITHTG